MDQSQIKALIDAMSASDLTEMAFSQDGWTLRLVRHGGPAAPGATPPSAPGPSPKRAAAPRSAAERPARPKELRAPLYGVLHLQPAPGEPPFVTAGQPVRAGQTLCVIEAMKVFNEVHAEFDAVVEAVLIGTGQEVDVGQPLLRFA